MIQMVLCVGLGLWVVLYILALVFRLRVVRMGSEQQQEHQHHRGHPLDLPREFVQDNFAGVFVQHDPDAVRVMSLASYLTSLRTVGIFGDFGVGRVEFWRVLLALGWARLSVLLGFLVLPLLVLMPGSVVRSGDEFFGLKIDVEEEKEKGKGDGVGVPFTSSAIAFLHKVDTIVSGTSVVNIVGVSDLCHFFFGREGGRFGFIDFHSSLIGSEEASVIWRKPAEDLKSDMIFPDAVDIMLEGFDRQIKDEAALPILPNPLKLLNDRDVIFELTEMMDLGPEPDKLHYFCPRPFAPELFPDLCYGWGGVTPRQTPRQKAKNRIMSTIFNRLAANVYRIAGVFPSPGGGVAKENNNLFIVIAPDGEEIIFPERLVEKFGLSCHLFHMSSAYGATLCVRDKLPWRATEPPLDSTNPGDREIYTQIPTVLTIRTGIRDPRTGESIKYLSSHAGLAIIGEQEDNSPFGSFELHVFLGPEGLMAFHHGNEYGRPWSKHIFIDNPNFDSHECVQACLVASVASLASNLTARKNGLSKGGYILNGVCYDAVAIIEKVVRNKISLFPLIGQGDFVLGIIFTIRNELIPRLTDLHHPLGLKSDVSSQMDRLLNTLRKVAEAASILPQDVTVGPAQLDFAIERILFSTSEEVPFEFVPKSRKRLLQIRKEWQDALNPIPNKKS